MGKEEIYKRINLFYGMFFVHKTFVVDSYIVFVSKLVSFSGTRLRWTSHILL